MATGPLRPSDASLDREGRRGLDASERDERREGDAAMVVGAARVVMENSNSITILLLK